MCWTPTLWFGLEQTLTSIVLSVSTVYITNPEGLSWRTILKTGQFGRTRTLEPAGGACVCIHTVIPNELVRDHLYTEVTCSYSLFFFGYFDLIFEFIIFNIFVLFFYYFSIISLFYWKLFPFYLFRCRFSSSQFRHPWRLETLFRFVRTNRSQENIGIIWRKNHHHSSLPSKRELN